MKKYTNDVESINCDVCGGSYKPHKKCDHIKTKMHLQAVKEAKEEAVKEAKSQAVMADQELDMTCSQYDHQDLEMLHTRLKINSLKRELILNVIEMLLARMDRKMKAHLELESESESDPEDPYLEEQLAPLEPLKPLELLNPIEPHGQENFLSKPQLEPSNSTIQISEV